MTSRYIASQQLRGEELVGGKPKNIAGEGRNRRRVLNDIGNLVTLKAPEVKPQMQISKPMTRSFGPQLITKPQARALIDDKKKSVVAVNGVQRVASKALAPAKEKGPNKPKPCIDVIVISPDTEEAKEKGPNKPKPCIDVIVISPDTEEKKLNHTKADADCSGSARRKVPTTTWILAARSRAACGLVADYKPKDLIVDIDAADVDNELAVVEYVEDIYRFYKLTENETQPRHDYMDSQPELNEKMRAILVDWLIEVHNRFKLMPETLYLAINLVDRFLSLKTVPRGELQLVGISAMLIACKYEEIWAPQVNEFVSISDKLYTNAQILRMEKTILGKLEWNITVPTPYMFLDRYIKASIPDNELENMVYFLAELALLNYTALVYCPSMVAASAVYVARRILHKSPAWTDTLKLHTQFTEAQLIDCANLLMTLHSTASESKLQEVFRKYSRLERCAVALICRDQSKGLN